MIYIYFNKTCIVLLFNLQCLETERIERVFSNYQHRRNLLRMKRRCALYLLGFIKPPKCRKAICRVPATIDLARAEKSTNRFSAFQTSIHDASQSIYREAIFARANIFLRGSLEVVTSFSDSPGEQKERQTNRRSIRNSIPGHRGTLIDVLINQRPVSRARGGADRGD